MGPLAIFGTFLRFGFLAWGGPIAQIAMIRQALVDEQQWLTSERFNRLLAVYQALPGPEAHELCVHLGRMRGGPLGGLLAGLGFMLPGFVLVLGLAALYSRFDLSDPAIASAMLGIQIAVIHAKQDSAGLICARTPQQVHENLAASRLHLDATTMAELNRVTDELKVALGSNADLWAGESRIR
mgnify:CR=1 FL=1